MSRGLGCSGVAVALMKAKSPKIAAGKRPRATAISTSQVCIRIFKPVLSSFDAGFGCRSSADPSADLDRAVALQQDAPSNR